MGHQALTDTLMRELCSRTQGHGRPTGSRPRDFPSTSKSDTGPLTRWRANSAEGHGSSACQKTARAACQWWHLSRWSLSLAPQISPIIAGDNVAWRPIGRCFVKNAGHSAASSLARADQNTNFSGLYLQLRHATAAPGNFVSLARQPGLQQPLAQLFSIRRLLIVKRL
jgi:hypothetical protein